VKWADLKSQFHRNNGKQIYASWYLNKSTQDKIMLALNPHFKLYVSWFVSQLNNTLLHKTPLIKTYITHQDTTHPNTKLKFIDLQ